METIRDTREWYVSCLVFVFVVPVSNRVVRNILTKTSRVKASLDIH